MNESHFFMKVDENLRPLIPAGQAAQTYLVPCSNCGRWCVERFHSLEDAVAAAQFLIKEDNALPPIKMTPLNVPHSFNREFGIPKAVLNRSQDFVGSAPSFESTSLSTYLWQMQSDKQLVTSLLKSTTERDVFVRRPESFRCSWITCRNGVPFENRSSEPSSWPRRYFVSCSLCKKPRICPRYFPGGLNSFVCRFSFLESERSCHAPLYSGDLRTTGRVSRGLKSVADPVARNLARMERVNRESAARIITEQESDADSSKPMSKQKTKQGKRCRDDKNETEKIHWLCCDKCEKWRIVPASFFSDAMKRENEKFLCSDVSRSCGEKGDPE